MILVKVNVGAGMIEISVHLSISLGHATASSSRGIFSATLLTTARLADEGEAAETLVRTTVGQIRCPWLGGRRAKLVSASFEHRPVIYELRHGSQCVPEIVLFARADGGVLATSHQRGVAS